MSEEIEIQNGDVFITPEGPIRVLSNHYELKVEDPTVTHPQDARASPWHIDPELFEQDLKDPDSGVRRASLEVVCDE